MSIFLIVFQLPLFLLPDERTQRALPLLSVRKITLPLQQFPPSMFYFHFYSTVPRRMGACRGCDVWSQQREGDGRGIQSLRGIFDLQGTRKKHFLSFSTLRRYVDKSIDKISMVDVRFFPFFPLLIHLFIVGYICLSVMLNMYKEQIDMSLLIGIYRIYLTLEIKSFSSQLINLYLNLNTF